MIVVTGGAGFIGSNLVRGLNERGEDEILVVDDLADASKVRNLTGCRFIDYLDRDDFPMRLARGELPAIRAIFHQGACSDTMEADGRYMMRVNYDYSRTLLDHALEHRVPFIYASSASVYGAGTTFGELPGNEDALNVYALSKLLFDRRVRRRLPEADSQVVGLRYFNVYGPGEAHKGRMASVARHFHTQYAAEGRLRLFVGSGGYGDGDQQRDFLWVGDAVKVNLHFLEHPDVSGIFNVGTGVSRSFNDVALAVIGAHDGISASLAEARDAGRITYIPFPEGLRDKYQSYTCADTAALRNSGFDDGFTSVQTGVGQYVRQLTGEP